MISRLRGEVMHGSYHFHHHHHTVKVMKAVGIETFQLLKRSMPTLLLNWCDSSAFRRMMWLWFLGSIQIWEDAAAGKTRRHLPRLCYQQLMVVSSVAVTVVICGDGKGTSDPPRPAVRWCEMHWRRCRDLPRGMSWFSGCLL